MTDTAAVQTWEVDRDLLVIREVGAGGLPLFEILSATSWADVHLAAAAPAMLAALEAIAEHQPERVYRTQEELDEANACPQCQLRREQSWPPLMLCPTHEHVYFRYVHINERAEKYHDADLRRIARAAIAQARGEKVERG